MPRPLERKAPRQVILMPLAERRDNNLRRPMSKLASGAFAGVAGVLAFGAVHLDVAAGNGLPSHLQRSDIGQVRFAQTDVATSGTVNRGAKGDRDPRTRPSGGFTVSYQAPGSSDVSVIMHVPTTDAADALRKAPATTTGRGSSAAKGSSSGGRTVACEPVVSVLTSVAKQLQPGRCIT